MGDELCRSDWWSLNRFSFMASGEYSRLMLFILKRELSILMTNPSTSAIRFDQVSRYFGEVKAVDHVDLEIRDGEFFSMLGPSGSGKTTCLRMIAGFDRPTSGH